MIRRILRAVAKRLPCRVISAREGNDVYLERYYLCGDVGGLKYFPEGQQEPRWWQRPLTWLPCIYLHRFARSDDDVELHNHPWTAKSLILAGGYIEERRAAAPMQLQVAHARDGRHAPKYAIEYKRVRPGQVNVLGPDTFHKVTLMDADCWSVIKIGEKVQTWGFWHPKTGEFVHWREHLERRRAKVTSRGGRA